MASSPDNAPLIAIVGETASGKTALGISLAQFFDGEIICADSRTIYQGMDIASAKPTKLERQAVPHHVLDVVTPAQPFSAAQFKEQVSNLIADVTARHKLPIMVGGSGLYVDAVLFNYTFSSISEPTERARLQSMDIEALQAEIAAKNIPMPANSQNPRHLVRAIETGGTSQTRTPLRANTLVLGVRVERDVLKQRIEQRVSYMFKQGLVGETERLAAQFGWQAPALQAPGYDALRALIDGHIDEAEAKRLFIQSHLKLAKRQRTWFKRNKSIHWISKQAEAVELVTTFLNK